MTTTAQETAVPTSPSVQSENPVKGLQSGFELSGQRLPYKPEQDSPAWLIPGETETKKQNAPNTILMRKNMPERIYRGGKKTDLFLLTQPIREPRSYGVPASVLQGDEGGDWVAMPGVSARTSIADLRKNTDDPSAPEANYGYLSTGNLFYWLSGVEHIIGHANTSDRFIGDEKNNIFIGHSASNPVISAILTAHLEKDQLKVLQRELNQDPTTQIAKNYMYGHDGNDTLIGSTGFYAGGEGADSYVVLPLKNAKQRDEFKINNLSSSQGTETDEVYLPGLYLMQDVEIRLEDDHFMIIPKDPSMHQRVLFTDFARSEA